MPLGTQPVITQLDVDASSPLRISTTPINPLDDPLKSHLISIYFNYVTATTPALHEATFFADLKPVNRHPDYLLDAIYGLACLFSQHPGMEFDISG